MPFIELSLEYSAGLESGPLPSCVCGGEGLLGNWKSDETSEKGQLPQAAWSPERTKWRALVCDDFLLQTGQFSGNTFTLP